MTRATMRNILRRRVDDPAPEQAGDTQWSNAELDEVLNTAAADIQAAIKAVDPEAFIRVTRSNIVADEPLVPKPQGAGAILDVKQLNASGNYVSMGQPIRFDEVDLYPTDTTQRRYAIVGRWIRLAWTPSATVTNGLEWWFSETVEIPTGTTDDTRSYPFDIALHDAVIYKAQLILGTEDNSSNEGVARLYAEALNKIPSYYRRTLQPVTPLSPNLNKMGQDYRQRVNPGGRDWNG